MSGPAAHSPHPRIVPRHPWELREVDESLAGAIADALGLHATTARVLVARGLDSAAAAERWLNPTLDALHSPFAFAQMEAAVDRLLHALRAGERIVVHGDYDVDGITGTVLLVTVLRHLGGDAKLLLPHRLRDGYGLNPAGVERARAEGGGLLIAVDCGITALAACDRARDLGMDVIVVDHHLPRAELPHAHAILNPRLADSGYPEDDLAAVGIAFKLARGLLQRHPANLSGIALLKLVALGTVADLVPLRGENRVLTYHGLAGLADAVNPGLCALMQVSGVDARAVTAGDVGFRLAPRINAAGRIGEPEDAAELFLTTDPVRARRLAAHLHRLNGERQELERGVVAQVLGAGVSAEDAIVVAAGEGWHRGVIGIVASRLVEETGRPSMVISIDGEEAHGSARSVPGFDIVAALAAAADLLTDYGGHHQAAGFHLPASRVPELREALVAGAAVQDPSAHRHALVCDDRLAADAISPALALELDRLAPFGIGNPRPRFLCSGLRLVGPPQRIKDAHLKLRIRGRDAEIEAMAWRRAELAGELAGIEDVSLVATLRTHRWGGRLSPQLEIVDLGA